jgi:hypothetical protein
MVDALLEEVELWEKEEAEKGTLRSGAPVIAAHAPDAAEEDGERIKLPLLN